MSYHYFLESYRSQVTNMEDDRGGTILQDQVIRGKNREELLKTCRALAIEAIKQGPLTDLNTLLMNEVYFKNC